MTTHETLRKICNIIGYTPKYDYTVLDIESNYHLASGHYYVSGDYFHYGDGMPKIISPVEIIFNPVFMEKFVKYYDNQTLLGPKRIYEQLGLNLLNGNFYDPTSYIANLLGIGTEKN